MGEAEAREGTQKGRLGRRLGRRQRGRQRGRQSGRQSGRQGGREAGNTIYSWLLFLPFISVFYFSLLFHPSPAEEAQQEYGAAETEFDAHGGPDALKAERGG